jgi:Class II flagellar assembly regulator
MRIQGPGASGALATAAPARRAASGAFAVADDGATRAPAQAAPLRTVGGIDALIALQGVGDATERRRHAMKRGRLALDALEELKIGLLGGTLDPAALTRLKAVAAHLKDGSGEPGLDGVLSEIALRVEVEIAKLGPPRRELP